MKPALGMIEITSIAGGFFVCDALVKKAPVEILQAAPVCPGKFLVLFHGDEASVEESLHAGLQAGKNDIIDFLYIPNIHTQVPRAIRGNVAPKIDAVAIVETSTVVASIVGADLAVKAAEVFLLELKLSGGLGGKGFFILTGSLDAVEAAVEAALQEIEQRGALIRKEIIPAPHEDLIKGGIF